MGASTKGDFLRVVAEGVLREGRIQLSDEVVATPSLTEAALLDAMGDRAKPSVANRPHRSYVLPSLTLMGRPYTPSVYFTGGLITLIDLTWADPARVLGSDPWANWSAERERVIARDDAQWLSMALDGAGSTTQTYSFDWGTVWSGFDERSGYSSVGIRYNRR
ncbi:MAG: hypothetical protein Q8L23_15515 [Caulobacter sp.]|nr:hypothetical protein [Caulobacter sp.]